MKSLILQKYFWFILGMITIIGNYYNAIYYSIIGNNKEYWISMFGAIVLGIIYTLTLNRLCWQIKYKKWEQEADERNYGISENQI